MQSTWGKGLYALLGIFVFGQPILAASLPPSPKQIRYTSCANLFGAMLPLKELEVEVRERLRYDKHKWVPMSRVLKRRLTDREKLALIKVYESSRAQLGNRELAAGIYDGEGVFTKKQLQKKEAILRGAGFSPREIDRLLQHPEALGPDTMKNDKIRLAIRDLRERHAERLAILKTAMKDDARMRRLPRWKGKGEIPHLSALERIHYLFGPRGAEEAFALGQGLELEVMVRSTETERSGEQALQDVYAYWEKAHGFKPTFDLEPRVYWADEWRGVMRNGAIPRDPSLRDTFGLGKGTDELEFAQHGYDTHRWQWHIVMRDMAINPQYYTSLGSPPKASALFRFLGEEILVKKLDWKGTGYPGYLTGRGYPAFPGSQTLWDGLFEGDGFQNDLHNTLFVRKMINDLKYQVWPTLHNISQ